jgi:hypothetical protein
MSQHPKPIDTEVLKRRFDYDQINGGLLWKSCERHPSIKKSRTVGSLNINGYIESRLFPGGKQFKVHRLVWAFHFGDPGKSEIDHINGNKHDNRIENLRLSTRADNTRNVKLRSNNKSGVKGVSWHKATKKWKAQIQCDKKKIGLGYFKTIEEAKNVVMSARIKLHESFANHG